jgi:DNA invertase Pin-like site-specific DNA recombinase
MVRERDGGCDQRARDDDSDCLLVHGRRTSDGRGRAKARGVRFGRPPKLTLHQRVEAIARRNAGEALIEIARSYNVSHPTISRL